MDRLDAIDYLQRKGKIGYGTFNNEEQELINKVMEKGKIFGDPVVEMY